MYGRRQAELKKAALISEMRAKEAFKKAMVFIEKIRAEVFTNAYTQLERVFGEQAEATLEIVDSNIQADLRFLDKRWKQQFEQQFIKNRKPGVEYVLVKHDIENPDGEKEQSLAQAIRDELIEAMAKHAYKIIGIDQAKVEEWMNVLVAHEDMQPMSLIRQAKERQAKWK